MTDTIKIVKALETVAGTTVRAWQDRYYVNFDAARGSRANGDLRTKVWIKGDTLTVELGKGYTSDTFNAALNAVTAAARSVGATVRGA